MRPRQLVLSERNEKLDGPSHNIQCPLPSLRRREDVDERANGKGSRVPKDDEMELRRSTSAQL